MRHNSLLLVCSVLFGCGAASADKGLGNAAQGPGQHAPGGDRQGPQQGPSGPEGPGQQGPGQGLPDQGHQQGYPGQGQGQQGYPGQGQQGYPGQGQQDQRQPIPAWPDAGDEVCSNAYLDYDVVTLGNFEGLNADVEGRVAVGGHARLTSYSVGANLPYAVPGGLPSLVVAGDLWFQNGSIKNGPLMIDGTPTIAGADVAGVVRQGARGLLAGLVGGIRDASARLARMPANGDTIRTDWDGARGGLRLEGHDPVMNVFLVHGDDLGLAHTISIAAPPGSSVIVNVTGEDMVIAHGGVLLYGPYGEHVVFNAYEALHVGLAGVGLDARLLAPRAHVDFGNGVVRGGIYAGSLSGPGQVNHVRGRPAPLCRY